ncbi:hypothetical protein [Xenorhabdus innexi]|uniref:Coenzyme PQQ synthesis protein D (PqqD) n=1 Tax=Xenorhabdus innexi TaxID=290109 RepID=A0A1N6MW44_9GAMM|nr:hypothetical protein [Xenorhabdus innexi]PHM37557.1 hypothetical protein Xinn_00942 [Xenorhabdus innexi]SIP72959.1 hypothetical protein XIS1_1700010 [Xenorhabdus innexi]
MNEIKEKFFIKKKDVISTSLDEEEVILLDKKNDTYIGLIGAAKDIWTCNIEIISISKIVEELQIDNDVDLDNLKEAIYLLEKEGLIFEYTS